MCVILLSCTYLNRYIGPMTTVRGNLCSDCFLRPWTRVHVGVVLTILRVYLFGLGSSIIILFHMVYYVFYIIFVYVRNTTLKYYFLFSKSSTASATIRTRIPPSPKPIIIVIAFILFGAPIPSVYLSLSVSLLPFLVPINHLR